jgi:hypothetical protein
MFAKKLSTIIRLLNLYFIQSNSQRIIRHAQEKNNLNPNYSDPNRSHLNRRVTSLKLAAKASQSAVERRLIANTFTSSSHYCLRGSMIAGMLGVNAINLVSTMW